MAIASSAAILKNKKILIVDDEPEARELLKYILQEKEGLEVVGMAGNVDEALFLLQQEKPDLVFLDIQMPEVGGFDVLREVGAEAMPLTVFATAFDEYAVDAFELHAVDYLLKPINDERLAAAIDRARQARDERLASQHRSKLLKLVCELTGREVTLMQRKSGKLGAGLGKTTGWIHRATLKMNGVRMIGDVNYERIAHLQDKMDQQVLDILFLLLNH